MANVHLSISVTLKPASDNVSTSALTGLNRPMFDLLDLVDEDDHDVPEKVDWYGRTLGPWRVGEQIGRGGMSVIHSGLSASAL